MPDVVGTLILTAIGAAEIATMTIGSVSVATIVGNIAIAAVLIGVQYALRPELPKAEQAEQSVKQNIPPVQYGYGRHRVGPKYMFSESANGNSHDILAVEAGPIAGYVHHYLHSEAVALDPGGGAVVDALDYDDVRYNGVVQITTRRGLSTETAYGETVAAFPGSWTTAHRGDGIASVELVCRGVKQEEFLKFYPHGLCNYSPVIDAAPIWDPRDPDQHPDDPATWIDYPAWSNATTYASGDRIIYRGVLFKSRNDDNLNNIPDEAADAWIYVWENPVLQRIDYLIRPDRGIGYSRTKLIDPVLDALMVEADLCDEAVMRKDGSIEPRYAAGGGYTSETDPAEVAGAMLGACDGYETRDGDGLLSLRVGVYRAPTTPAVDDAMIVAFAPNYGTTSEESCNDLQISFTSPPHKYTTQPAQAWRNEENISERGKTLSKELALPWTRSHAMARRLGKRTKARFDAAATGVMVLNWAGLIYLGERWVRLQLDHIIDGFGDVVVEITDIRQDWNKGQFTFAWLVINQNEIDAWDAETEEGEPPPVPANVSADALPVPEDIVASTQGDALNGYFIRLTFEHPGRYDLSYAIRYRIVSSSGGRGPWIDQAVISVSTDGTTITVDSTVITVLAEYEVEVAAVGARGTLGEWSEPPAYVTSANALLRDDGSAYRREDGSIYLRE